MGDSPVSLLLFSLENYFFLRRVRAAKAAATMAIMMPTIPMARYALLVEVAVDVEVRVVRAVAVVTNVDWTS